MTLKDDNSIETEDGNIIRFDIEYDAHCACYVAIAWSGNLVSEGISESEAVSSLKRILAAKERHYGSWSNYVRFREHLEKD